MTRTMSRRMTPIALALLAGLTLAGAASSAKPPPKGKAKPKVAKPTPRPAAPKQPACPGDLSGYFKQKPVDLALVTGIGPPGQVRGGNYKGHGYFRVSSNDTPVVTPAAATLYEGSRYVEAGEVQYLLYFRTSCGLVFLLDHVLQPAARALAAYAGKPEAKPDDSRTYSLGPVTFAAGERVADAVGFRTTGNASVDFGVYDPSKPNAASKRAGFRGNAGTWRDANALCWYELFAPADGVRIRSLVGVGATEGAQSDICPS